MVGLASRPFDANVYDNTLNFWGGKKNGTRPRALLIAALQIYQIICCNLQYVYLFLLILLRALHGGPFWACSGAQTTGLAWLLSILMLEFGKKQNTNLACGKNMLIQRYFSEGRIFEHRWTLPVSGAIADRSGKHYVCVMSETNLMLIF